MLHLNKIALDKNLDDQDMHTNIFSSRFKRPREGGFTLIELMITVVIIGILTAVAVPNYSRYVVRSNRAMAHTEMMDIANREQQYLLANRAYGDATALGYTLPSALTSKYTPTVVPTAATATTPPTFLITFTPVAGGTQADDGALTLNNDGLKTGTW